MRNLLYTFLIGLVIVSCQKEEYGADYSSISPIDNVTVGPNFNAAKSTLESLMGVATPVKGAVASTAKAGNSLRLVVWNTTGNSTYADGLYAHVISEEYTACYDSYSPSFDASYDWDTNNNILTITIDGEDATFPINGALRDTYDTDFGTALYFLAKVGETDNGGYFVSGAQPEQVPAPSN